MQKDAAPKVDKSLKGFKIEMLFSAHDDEGVPFVNWYHGVVDELLNEKGRRVSIKWDEDCLGTKDACITKHRLGITKWNPEICTDGAWRHYITE